MFWCAAGFSLLVCCPERKGAESRCYEIYTSQPAQPPPPPRQARVSAQLRSVNAGTAAPRRSARGRGPQSGGGTRVRQGPGANTRLRLQSARTRPRRLLSGGHNKGQSAHSQGPEEAGSGGASERSFSRREPRAPHSPSAAARLPPAARPAGPAPPPGAPPPRPLPRRGRPTNRARARRGVSWRSASERQRAISRAARGGWNRPAPSGWLCCLGAGPPSEQLWRFGRGVAICACALAAHLFLAQVLYVVPGALRCW